MSTAAVHTHSLTQELPTAPRVNISKPVQVTSTLPTIDLSNTSPEVAFDVLSTAASSTGVALITNLAARPPITAIQRLFARLYADPALAARLNATYPTRGVFKAACLNPSSNPAIDQKTTIDLSVRRLQHLRDLDPALVDELGADFTAVLAFYAAVEGDILPLLTAATSRLAGGDVAPLHAQANNNLRLIDYFQGAGTGPRCGEHRDYGTFTVVFQDGAVGGLEFDVDGKWIQVPAHVDAVVSWGWCGAILSNDRIKAARHRVLRTWPATERRTTAVVFVAPDLEACLRPLVLEEGEGARNAWRDGILNGEVTTGAFKEVIAKKWRRREGNEEGEVVEGAQDREVSEWLRPEHA